MSDWLPVVELLGARIHSITEAGAIRYILDQLQAGRGGWVVTHNVDHLRRLFHDDSFASLCRTATLVVADGMPLVWASRLQGTPLPERVTGSNLISSLSIAAAEESRAIFLLGGDPGTADAAAYKMKTRTPALRIAGTYCPPLGFESDAMEMEQLVARVTSAAPDIIFVGLGSPKQERLIHQLRPRLPHAWWLGVGISFSFVCGRVTRAPTWAQRAGLEWVHRLVREPQRLSRRYLRDDLPFAARLLTASAWRGLAGAAH